MYRIISALLLISCLSLSAPAFAAHPLATDDTVTTGRMKFHVETSAEFGWDRETGNGITTKAESQSYTASVTAGLIDPLDLVLAFPFSWQQVKENDVKTFDNGGLNDLTLSLKWRFLEAGPAGFAIKPAITFPSGDHDRGLGAARPAYGVTLISTVELSPLAIHANVGYTLQNLTDSDKDSGREDLWNLSLAGTVEVMKGLQLVAEICTATNGNKADTIWPTFMSGGVIHTVIEDLDLSLGVKVGLTDPETDIALLTGITLRLP